ncbi:MAG: hypothetical protein ACP5UU_05895 [Thermoprotei archaeon]
MSLLNSSSSVFRPVFVGLSTYMELFSSSTAVGAIVRSLIWALLAVLVVNSLGIVISALIFLLENDRNKTIALSIFVYPLAISSAASSLIWSWIFNVKDGINYLLVRIGLPSFPWLDSASTAFPSLFIISIWMFTGLGVLFYLAT